MSTIINKDVLKGINAVLSAAYPNEACGFLLGHEADRLRQITEFREVDNISTENQRRRFVIDPLDYMQAEKYALKNGLQLLGVYHSHPDHPAIPSVHDLEYAQPFFSYFIHSIENGRMVSTHSYRLVNGSFIEEKFSIHQPIKI